jgi:hypothetical protein
MTSASGASLSRRTVLKSSAAGAVVAAGWNSRSSAQDVAKATFVLVHPAWFVDPEVGGSSPPNRTSFLQ